ncbi:MAG: ABC transporter substrate-binding protein [Candidatus Sumerlaeaceae bacterium]
MNAQRAKTLGIFAAVLTLFAWGWWSFGFPPPKPLISEPGSDESTPGTSNGRIVIRGNNAAMENDAKRQAEQDLGKRLFEERYPDAIMGFSTWQFSPETFFAKSIAGTLPEVIGVFATEAANLLDRRLCADITEQVQGWEHGSQLNMNLLQPMMRDGRIYGLPTMPGFYVMLMFYNKDMFRDAGIVDERGEPVAPDTWDDFTTVAKRLTDRTRGIAGFGILGETGGNGWHFLNWVWQAGGDFEKKLPDGRWISVFHEPPAVQALQFVKDLRWKHDVLQRNVLASNDELFQLFASGRIAMAIFTMEYLQNLVDKYEMPLQRIGIALLPAGPGGRANQIGGGFALINPRLTGLRKQRAFDMLVLDADLQVIDQKMKLLHSQGRRVGIPAVPIFKPEYQAKYDAVIDKYRNLPAQRELMEAAAKAARFEPARESQTLYRDYLGPAVQDVLVSRNANPGALLDSASKRFQARVLDALNRQAAQPVQLQQPLSLQAKK